MNKIMPSAYLDLCPHCRRHFRVVFADGERSEPVTSAEAGKEVLTVALHEGQIDMFEDAELRRQIDALGLKESAIVPPRILATIIAACLGDRDEEE